MTSQHGLVKILHEKNLFHVQQHRSSMDHISQICNKVRNDSKVSNLGEGQVDEVGKELSPSDEKTVKAHKGASYSCW